MKNQNLDLSKYKNVAIKREKGYQKKETTMQCRYKYWF